MPERFSWIIDDTIAGMKRPGLFYPLDEDLAFLKSQRVEVIVNLQEREHFIDHPGFTKKYINRRFWPS